MKRENPLLARLKGIRLQDRNALWLAAFTALAVLCLILAIAVGPFLLRLLFVLIMIGAVLYCWLLIQDRRNMPRRAHEPVPEPSSEEPATGMPQEAEVPEPAGEPGGEADPEISAESPQEPATEDPQPGKQAASPVLVSDKGDKYHRNRKCMGLRFADSLTEMTEAEAEALGRKPCGICWPKAKEG